MTVGARSRRRRSSSALQLPGRRNRAKGGLMATIKGRVLIGVVAVGLLLPATGHAQAAKGKKAPAGAVEIEEITVTAQKREEALQEIPLSVTAINGGNLKEQGVANLAALGE